MAKQKGKGRKEVNNDETVIQDERYRLLFESSSDAIMLLDRDRFFDCNKATLAMFGLSKEAFIRLHPSEISPPVQLNGKDSRTEADKRISEAFEKGVNRFEWIHRRSNGEDFAVLVWLTAFPLEGRQVLQATVRELSQSDETQMDLEAHRLQLQILLDERTDGIKKEVIERKKAESEVKRLIKAVETTFNAVALFDMDMNITYANNSFSKLAKVPMNKLISRNAADFIPHDSLIPLTEQIIIAIDGEDLSPLELKVHDAEGFEIWVEIAGSVLFDENGEPEGILAIINNISERRAILEALRESEEKFKMLVEQSMDGILIVQERKVAYMNPALVALSGYTLEEQVGRDFIENVAPEARKAVMAAYKARMSGKSVPNIYETVLLTKNGARIPMEVNATVMEYNGKPADFIYLRDLTERHRAMDEIRLTKERLEYILGATNTGYDIIDPDFNVVYVDPAWAKKLGDYHGKKCYDYFMGLKNPCEICGIQMALKTKKTIVTEEYLMKEGRHIEVHTIPFKTDGGSWLVAEFNIDITNQKMAYSAIMECETRYRELTTGISSGLAVYQAVNDGNDFIIVDFNRAAEKIEGVKSADVIGKHVTDVFPGIRDIGLLNTFKRVWETGVPEHHPISFYKDNRLTGWRENYVYKLPSGEVAAIYNDVTERKMGEEALKTSEEKYRTLMERANDAIFLADAKTGLLIDVNQSATELMGMTREELIGMHQAKLHPAEEIKRYEKIFRTHVKSGRAIEEFLYVVHKDGHRIPVSISASIFEIGGRTINQGIFHDLTERFKAENAVKEADEKVRTLFTSMKDLVFGFDVKGFFISCHTPPTGKLFLPQEIFIGKKYSEVMPPHVTKQIDRGMKYNQKNQSYDFEYSLEIGGQDMWFSAKMSPVFIDGQFNGSVAVVRDITGKKSIEEALRISEQVYRSLYESTMVLGDITDLTRIMEVIAEQARNMLDGECATIYLWDRNRKVLVPYYTNAPDEQEKFMAFDIKPGTGLTGSVAQKKEGSYANYNDSKATKAYVPGTKSKKDHLQSIIAEPMMSDGNLLGVLNVLAQERVFTDEDLMKLRILAKQATVAYIHSQNLDELVKSEERFRKMGDNIHDGLLIIEDGSATYINERAVEIYGYPADELKTMSHMELVIPEDREQMGQIMENARKAGVMLGELEFWIQRKDGSRSYVRTRTSTSFEGGKSSQFIITTDITARKLAEDENKRKMMKYLLEDGRLYLVKEFRPSMSLEAFNDLLNMGYFGLVLSRTPKKDMLRSITGPFEHLWLGEQIAGEELFQKILSNVTRMAGKNVVLIDRLDYLIFKYGFKETLAFIFKLRDLIYLKEQVVIVSMDTSTLKEDELNIMQKEMNEIEFRQVPKPTEELFEIAQMIYDKNSTGIKPSFSEIGDELKMSKPTFRKRVRHLINGGYAMEVTKGNKKVLELTQKGRSLFFK